MKKRFLSILLVLAILLPLLHQITPTSAATDYTVVYPVIGGNIYFDKLNGMIYNCDQSVTSAQIPEKIDGVTVKRIGREAFMYCASLTSVTIPDTVTIIDNYAFCGCHGLTNITIPESVTSVGDYIFSYCSGLTNVTILNRIMGDYMFEYCTSLKTVTIPGKVYSISIGAFYNCKNLTRVIIEDGVSGICDSAFASCENLSTVTIPKSVTTIGNDAFSVCKSLISVTIPNSVVKIGRNAFASCSSLTSVTIPESVSSIGSDAFNGCNLTHIIILNPNCSISDPNSGYTLAKPSTVVYGYANSTAEVHAKKYGHPFLLITTELVENPFGDVKESDYYFAPVLWAVEQGITNGTGNGKFSPDIACTRGQIVTFLWRAAGSPMPQTTENPFSDISKKAYYYNAVLWAVEQGITNGMGKGKFSPDDTCTREQVATFLWRAQGKPAPTSSTNPFNDVYSGTYYYNAVLWAVEEGVTNGMGKGKFCPDDSCTRGQIVTFLYRALA